MIDPYKLRSNKPIKCGFCDDTGVIELPSMLGWGTERYPCKCGILSDKIAAAVQEETHAWIMSNIR